MFSGRDRNGTLVENGLIHMVDNKLIENLMIYDLNI